MSGYEKIIEYMENDLANKHLIAVEQDADSFIASNMSWLSKWIDEAKPCSPLFAAHHLQVSTSYLIPIQSVEKGLVNHIRRILKELIFGDRGFRKKMGRLPVPEDGIKIFFIPQPNRGQGIDGYDKEGFSYSFLTKFVYLVFL